MVRIAVTAFLIVGAACAVESSASAAESCSGLAAGLKLKDATITGAVEVPAGGFKLPGPGGAPGGPQMDFSALPAF